MTILGAKPPVVLIVEDELLLRLIATEMANEAGFDALEAGDANEAIAILESHPNIHSVFTDIQMLGSMDGIKLFYQAKVAADQACHHVWTLEFAGRRNPERRRVYR